jgi:hypothetical protein
VLSNCTWDCRAPWTPIGGHLLNLMYPLSVQPTEQPIRPQSVPLCRLRAPLGSAPSEPCKARRTSSTARSSSSPMSISTFQVVRSPRASGYYGLIFSKRALTPERSTSDGAIIGTTLSSPLSTGGAITSLPINSLPTALPSGALVQIANSGNTYYQTWTLTSSAAQGATSLAVASQTPNFAYLSVSGVVSNILTSATIDFTSADVGSDLYVPIASVTNTTTAVLTLPAVTTVSAATLNIYIRDANIGITADAATTINSGTLGNTTTYPYLNQLRRIDGLSIKLNGANCVSPSGSSGGGCVFWSVGDITKFAPRGLILLPAQLDHRDAGSSRLTPGGPRSRTAGRGTQCLLATPPRRSATRQLAGR